MLHESHGADDSRRRTRDATERTRSVGLMYRAHMSGVTIKPARGFKDAHDIPIGALCGLVAVAFLATPFVGLSLALHWPFHPTFPVCAAIVLAVVLSHRVRHIELDETGIRFARLVGTKFVPWERVSKIQPASRRDVVLYGWLLPPFPPREATTALTSLGHYRLEWGDRYCFFPPAEADTGAFHAAIGRCCPRLRTETAG